MRKFFIFVLLMLAVPLLAVALSNAFEGQEISFVIGSTLPGFLLLIIALALRGHEREPKLRLWIPLLVGGFLAIIPLALPYLATTVLYSDNPATAWEWRSGKLDMIVQLPSDDWRKLRESDDELRLQNIKHRSHWGVKIAPCTEMEFNQRLQDMAKNVATDSANAVEPPVYVVSESRSGDPFSLWMIKAKGEAGNIVFLGLGLLWSKQKNAVLLTQLEAPLQMRTRKMQQIEFDYFAGAMKALLNASR